jgi:hypothetical protein
MIYLTLRVSAEAVAVNSADCGGNLSGCFSAQLRAVYENWAKWPALSGSVPGR